MTCGDCAHGDLAWKSTRTGCDVVECRLRTAKNELLCTIGVDVFRASYISGPRFLDENDYCEQWQEKTAAD